MKKYVIVPIEKVTDDVIKSVEQTTINTARKSHDGKNVVLSYEGERHAALEGHEELTHEQVHEKLSQPHWTLREGHPAEKRWFKNESETPAVIPATLSRVETIMLSASVSAVTALVVTGLGLLLHAHR